MSEADHTTGCRVILLASAPQRPAPWVISLDSQAVVVPGCRHVVEIVTHHLAHRQQARQRWRQYSAAGCILHRHDLNHNQLPNEVMP